MTFGRVLLFGLAIGGLVAAGCGDDGGSSSSSSSSNSTSSMNTGGSTTTSTNNGGSTTTSTSMGGGNAADCVDYEAPPEAAECFDCALTNCPDESLACANQSTCVDNGGTIEPTEGCLALLVCVVESGCSQDDITCISSNCDISSGVSEAQALGGCIGDNCSAECDNSGGGGGGA